MIPKTIVFGCALGSLLWLACAARPATEIVPVQEAAKSAYPPVIEASPARQQAAEEAWANFLSEARLSFAKPDLEPVLNTPRSLPPALAGNINLKTGDSKTGEALNEERAKELLRRFIERQHAVLGGDQRASTLGLKDLSLISFSRDGELYRATYRQMNYPFPIANGYGELRLALSRTGALVQLSSRILPAVELPAKAAVEREAVAAKLLNREFTYSNLAGQPLTYRVARREEISVKELVIYPKLEENKLTVHLAYPVEVGRGMTWTVYFDAVNGQEIEVKQNFQS